MPRIAEKSEAALPRIDVLIPAIEKDLRTLPHVVESVRLHSRNPVGEVIIVAPRKPSIQSLCRKNGWRFVDENTVLPITKQNIKYRSASWERSGWLFQQFLKLSGDKLCKADFFLVIDADTVLIRPHVFRSGGRTFFYTRGWTQPEYLRTYAKLMGSKPSSPRSLVTHYMLVEKTKLRELKQDIEARHGKSWYKAIFHSIDQTKQFGFSEYETYGNFVYSRNQAGVRLIPALNRSLYSRVDSLTPKKTGELAANSGPSAFTNARIMCGKGRFPLW